MNHNSRFALVTLISALVLMSSALIAHYYFPEKYFYDSKTIKTYICSEPKSFKTFSSYRNTALIYNKFGVGCESDITLPAIISLSITLLIALYILSNFKHEISLCNISYPMIWLLLSGIYLSQLSKEFLLLILLSGILYFFGKRTYLIISILILAAYALYFRNYWILVIALFLAIKTSSTSKQNISLPILIILSLIIIFMTSHALIGKSIFYFREIVNIDRNPEDSITIIQNCLEPTNLVYDVINYFCLLVKMFIITPLSILSLKTLAFFLFNLVNLYLIIDSLKNLRFSFYALSPRKRRRLINSLYLIISFTSIQILFEPDLGSYVKHQIALLPLYLYTYYSLASIKNYKKKIKVHLK